MPWATAAEKADFCNKVLHFFVNRLCLHLEAMKLLLRSMERPSPTTSGSAWSPRKPIKTMFPKENYNDQPQNGSTLAGVLLQQRSHS
jgi:hypothetical protein